MEQLIAGADPELSEMIAAYEPIEAQYRSAFASEEIFPTASSTVAMPRSLSVVSDNSR